MSLNNLERLAERYVSTDADGATCTLPNLHVLRKEAVSEFEAIVYNPVICLILRGSKETRIGTQSVSLSRGDALLVSHDLPVTSKITQASPAEPYLAIIVSLDLGIIRNLYEHVGETVSGTPCARSLTSNLAQRAWTDPLGRYLDLMDKP